MNYEFFNYIAFFIFILFVGGLFCIGWFNSTRGSTIIDPSGKERDENAMVFYWINKALSKKVKERSYSDGDNFNLIFKRIKEVCSGYLGDSYSISSNFDSISCYLRVSNHTLWEVNKQAIENAIGYSIIIEPLSGGHVANVRFYKEFDVDVYSKYIVKPIVGCYKCYASFWGTLIYVPSLALAIHTNLFEFNIVVSVIMWVIYCMSLVTVNVYFEKKTRS